MRRGNAFGLICMSVSDCHVRALTFENLGLETSYLYPGKTMWSMSERFEMLDKIALYK